MPGTPASTSEYLIAVGKIVNNASLNELLMFSSFKILSRIDVKLASAIFYTPDSLQAKKALLDRVVDVIGDDETKKLVKEIIDAAEKSNSQRRNVAHSILLWGTDSPDGPPANIFHPKSRKSEPPTRECLEDRVRKSRKAFEKGLLAFSRLCEKLGVPPEQELV